MVTDLLIYIFLGIVQVATAIWGGVVSARSMQPGSERTTHFRAFAVLALFGVALIVISGVRTIEAQVAAAKAQQTLESDLARAKSAVDQSLQRQEYMRGQLDSISVMVGKVAEQGQTQPIRDIASAIRSAIPGSGPDRHLTPFQLEQAKTALSRYKASVIGIATIKGDERMAFAREIANAFGGAGWTAIAYCIGKSQFDQHGLVIARHSQDNMPDVSPLRAALQAMKLPHTEVTVGPFEYPTYGVPCELLMGNSKGGNTLNDMGINTGTPVIFVGSKD